MTSEGIRERVNSDGFQVDFDDKYWQQSLLSEIASALWEIAYQLALAAERK